MADKKTVQVKTADELQRTEYGLKLPTLKQHIDELTVSGNKTPTPKKVK